MMDLPLARWLRRHAPGRSHLSASASSSSAFATWTLTASAWVTNSLSGRGTKLTVGRSSNSASIAVVQPACSIISAARIQGMALPSYSTSTFTADAQTRHSSWFSVGCGRTTIRSNAPAAATVASSACRSIICRVL